MGGDWDKLAMICGLIGYEADVLGIITYSSGPTDNRATPALIIIAFLLYTAASILFVLIEYSAIAANFIFSIVIACCSFIAAIFLVVGVGINKEFNDPYAGTLEISAAFLAIVAGAFTLIKAFTGDSSASETMPP